MQMLQSDLMTTFSHSSAVARGHLQKGKVFYRCYKVLKDN